MKNIKLIATIIFILASSTSYGLSETPWRNKTIVLPENVACNTTEFDGGAKPFSRTYVSVYADGPIWMVIYNGERYIRENISSRRRLVFNFITKSGFSMEVCRMNFTELRTVQEEQRKQAAAAAAAAAGNNAGATAPTAVPQIDSKKTQEINVVVNTN